MHSLHACAGSRLGLISSNLVINLKAANASLSEALVYRALPESFYNPCNGLEPG